MSDTEDKDTRYYIDLDLAAQSLIGWDHGDRNNLVQELPLPCQRVFISKGQYNKLVHKHLAVRTSTGQDR